MANETELRRAAALRNWARPEYRARQSAALRKVRGNAARWTKLGPYRAVMLAMQERGYTQAQIAAEIGGVTPGAVGYWLRKLRGAERV